MSQGLSLRVELNKTITGMFERIKGYYGFETNSDAIRFLITEKYREVIQEVPHSYLRGDKKEENSKSDSDADG